VKVIYSFNSCGGKYTPNYWYLRMAELSVQSIKNCGYKVELYVDAESADFFKYDSFCVSFDSVHVVNFMQFPHDSAYWNFGKLYVYSLQTEPFLHVDFDTYFSHGFKIPKNGSIVTEKMREYRHAKAFQDVSILPNQRKIPEKLICSGLLGGSAYFVYKELFDFACKYCQNPPPENDEIMSYLIGVEEYNLSQLAQYYQLPIKELQYDMFFHWQGKNKRERYGKFIKKMYFKTFGKEMFYDKDDKVEDVQIKMTNEVYACKVIRGRGRSRQLGFPTANLRCEDVIPQGTYAAVVEYEGVAYKGLLNNYGRAEVYILDFSGDIYGKTLNVALKHCFGNERTVFKNSKSLATAIALDCDKVRDIIQLPTTVAALEEL